jgi:hypothetical protein
VRHLHALVLALAAVPVPGATQSAAPKRADVRIVTIGGRVIRGRLTGEDSATLSVWPADAAPAWRAVVTQRDSVALLEVRMPVRFRAPFLVLGGAAGAAGGAMMGATVAWMECPFGQSLWCSAQGRRDQMRAVATGMEIGVVAGVVAGFFYRPGRWQTLPARRVQPAITGLGRGLGLGVKVPF